MVRAASVPPADLMGPAKDIDRYCEVSTLVLIVTSDMPCSGATVTPSVTTARETLTALSSRVFRSPEPYSPAAISSAIFSAAFSLVVCDKRARSLSAMSILCILATLSAKSYAILGSMISAASIPRRRALSACW
jgi:hypothetical protein